MLWRRALVLPALSRSRHTDLVGSDTCAVEQAHVNARFAPRHLNMMSDNMNINVQIKGCDFSEGGEAGIGRETGILRVRCL